MFKVFVDTSAFVALYVRSDDHHEEAIAAFQDAQVRGLDLATTNAVAMETYVVILRRTDGTLNRRRGNALRFLRDLHGDDYDLVRVEEEDERKAWAILHKYKDKEFSYCDASSFVVMERLGISHAIAYDGDFRSYGQFVLL